MYEEILSGNINIIVGTQQIAKGLDLPKLETVGLLQADMSLSFPDYSSDERTFQLISQVLGRVDRGHTSSKVLLQTFQPNNKIVQYALSEDWARFYRSELESRKVHGFPPTLFTAKIIFRNKSKKSALKEAEVAKTAVVNNNNIIINGPASSYYSKRGGYYYVQLILRSKSRASILEACRKLPASAIKDIDPISLL